MFYPDNIHTFEIPKQTDGMKIMNQYSHPIETEQARDFILSNNNCFLGFKNGHSYYNVNGVLWECFQSMGTSGLNTRHSMKLEDFN